jgi:hypothetical protein
LLLFEASAMGVKFTVLRFLLDIVGIAVIAYFTEKVLSQDEKQGIYTNAMKL